MGNKEKKEFKPVTLGDYILQMEELNRLGYETYFEGRGNGVVVPIKEYFTVL